MARIQIEFSRYSAFYSPLIMTFAGGYLAEEGLDAKYAVSQPGTSAIAALLDGSADVIQSAPGASFGALERGETPTYHHFAQINEMDGFFLTGREPDPAFAWSKLAGRRVVAIQGGQPLAMFKYACAKGGVDFAAIELVDAGDGDDMDIAFRAGRGDYIHQQGPAPQQLEADGVGHIVTAVGPTSGTLAFSSLAATDEWLASDMAKAFMRAYRKARARLIGSPAAEIAELEGQYFPGIDRDALTRCIATYQTLGCWTPHVEIRPEPFEVTLDVFSQGGLITRRHPFEAVVVPPPDAA